MKPNRCDGMIAATLALPALLAGGLGVGTRRCGSAAPVPVHGRAALHVPQRGSRCPPARRDRSQGGCCDPAPAVRADHHVAVREVPLSGTDRTASRFGSFSGKVGRGWCAFDSRPGFYQIERVGSRGQIRAFTAYSPAGSRGSQTKNCPAPAVLPRGSSRGGQRLDRQPADRLTALRRLHRGRYVHPRRVPNRSPDRQVALLTTTGQAPVHLRQALGFGPLSALDGSLSSSGTARCSWIVVRCSISAPPWHSTSPPASATASRYR